MLLHSPVRHCMVKNDANVKKRSPLLSKRDCKIIFFCSRKLAVTQFDTVHKELQQNILLSLFMLLQIELAFKEMRIQQIEDSFPYLSKFCLTEAETNERIFNTIMHFQSLVNLQCWVVIYYITFVFVLGQQFSKKFSMFSLCEVIRTKSLKMTKDQ